MGTGIWQNIVTWEIMLVPAAGWLIWQLMKHASTVGAMTIKQHWLESRLDKLESEQDSRLGRIEGKLDRLAEEVHRFVGGK